MKKLLFISSLVLAVSTCGPIVKKNSSSEKNQESKQEKKDAPPEETEALAPEGEIKEKETKLKKKTEAEKNETPPSEKEVGDEEANALYTANSITFKSELQLPLKGKINDGESAPYLYFVEGSIAPKPLYEEKRSSCKIHIDLLSPRGEDYEIYDRTKQYLDYEVPAFKGSMRYYSFDADWTYEEAWKPVKRQVTRVNIIIDSSKETQGVPLRRRDGKPTTAKIYGFECTGDSLTKESFAKIFGIPIELETLPLVE
jgi:hypothetical protein